MSVSAVRRIVVGVDGSAESAAALRWACREAALRGAEVHAIYVREAPYYSLASYAVPAHGYPGDVDADMMWKSVLPELDAGRAGPHRGSRRARRAGAARALRGRGHAGPRHRWRHAGRGTVGRPGDPRVPAPRALPGGRDQRRAGPAPGRRTERPFPRARGGSGRRQARHAADADPVVTDNPAESRYELHVGGELAGSVTYHLRGQQISLIHTEVDPPFQGAGLATHLARFSLDDARKRGPGRAALLPLHPLLDQEAPGIRGPRPARRRAEFGLTEPAKQRAQRATSGGDVDAGMAARFAETVASAALPAGIEADVWTGGETCRGSDGRG